MRTTWTFHSAGQLLFGPNATHHLGEVAVGLNIRRLLLVTDPVLMRSGLVDPVFGPLSAQLMWRWTPWIARARLAWLTRRHGKPLYPGERVFLQVWGQKGGGVEPLWRVFLTEQRAFLKRNAVVA